MLMQRNVFSFISFVIVVSVEYFSECNGYHLIPPTYNNLTRFKRQSSACRTRGQFACNNGQCIPIHNYCDGKSDCSDESDEVLNCNTNGCSSYTFRCAYGACVDGDSKCDGKKDCRDNSDETDCGGTANNNCGSQFGCKSGECIDKYLVCDGLANCSDGSDETYDLCNGIACQGYSFRCAYGACVDGDAKCDGKKDCIDNSDEDVKICGGVSTTTESPDGQGCAAPTIENGKFTVSGIGYIPGSLIKESSVITIECNTGYKLSVNNLPKCVAGVWSIEVPKCVPANVTPVLPTGGDCPSPVIENGKYEILGNGQHVPGNPIPNYGIVKFTCINDNYALATTNNVVYCVNGEFQSELPKCVRSCAARFSTSIDVECELNGVKQDCSKKVPEGTIATMKCKTHYVEYGRGPSTAICSGGSWDVPPKQCFPECGELVPKAQTLIVNGTSTKKGEFPWHVAIYRQAPAKPLSYICGGSIISVKVVLSAAHCFAEQNNGKLFPTSEFSLAAGKYFSDWDDPQDADFVQKRRVFKIEIPKDIYLGYQSSYAGDIAVVVVDKPFVLTNLIKPVCVDWNSEYVETQLRSATYGQVAGWGSTKPGNIVASVDLKQLTVPFIDRGQCLEIVPQDFRTFITLDKYCAGYKNGSSVCSGDSGGGMVFPQEEFKGKKYYIQGVVSLGPQIEGACDDHQIGVYTKVASHIQFIRRIEVSNRIN